MDIVLISLLAIVTVLLILSIKELKPDFAVLISTVFGLIIILYLVDPISETLSAFSDIAQRSGIKSEILSSLAKVVGISFIAEFAASICNDAGQTSIASKVESAGRIIILALALPIITDMLDSIFSILS